MVDTNLIVWQNNYTRLAWRQSQTPFGPFETPAVSKFSRQWRHLFMLFEGSRAPIFAQRWGTGRQNTILGLHCKRGLQMWEMSFCLFGKANKTVAVPKTPAASKISRQCQPEWRHRDLFLFKLFEGPRIQTRSSNFCTEMGNRMIKHYTEFALQEGNTNVKNGLGTHTTTSSPSQPCVSDLKFESDSEAGLRLLLVTGPSRCMTMRVEYHGHTNSQLEIMLATLARNLSVNQ